MSAVQLHILKETDPWPQEKSLGFECHALSDIFIREGAKPTVSFFKKQGEEYLALETSAEIVQTVGAVLETKLFANSIIVPKEDNGCYVIKGVPVSDGYHTFDELYEHRIELYLCLTNLIFKTPGAPLIWKSRKHSDGTTFAGWFVLGIGSNPGEQITYHLPEKYWSQLQWAREMATAPEWDGHGPQDVLTRLIKLRRQL